MREEKIDVIVLHRVYCTDDTARAQNTLKIWVMLGVVILFTLFLSYFLVIGVYDISARGE